MPYVNIKVTNEGVTSDQKAELIVGVTELLQKVLNKDPATTFVVIDEVETDNWGIAGEQVTLLRKRSTLKTVTTKSTKDTKKKTL